MGFAACFPGHELYRCTFPLSNRFFFLRGNVHLLILALSLINYLLLNVFLLKIIVNPLFGIELMNQGQERHAIPCCVTAYIIELEKGEELKKCHGDP